MGKQRAIERSAKHVSVQGIYSQIAEKEGGLH